MNGEVCVCLSFGSNHRMTRGCTVKTGDLASAASSAVVPLSRTRLNVAQFQEYVQSKSGSGRCAGMAPMPETAAAAESISGPALPEGDAAARLSGPRCVIDHPADSPVRNSFITARARHTPDSRADRERPPARSPLRLLQQHPACMQRDALRNSCSLSASRCSSAGLIENTHTHARGHPRGSHVYTWGARAADSAQLLRWIARTSSRAKASHPPRGFLQCCWLCSQPWFPSTTTTIYRLSPLPRDMRSSCRQRNSRAWGLASRARGGPLSTVEKDE